MTSSHPPRTSWGRKLAAGLFVVFIALLVRGRLVQREEPAEPSYEPLIERNLTVSGTLPKGWELDVIAEYRAQSSHPTCKNLELTTMESVPRLDSTTLATLHAAADGTFRAELKVRPPADAEFCKPKFTRIQLALSKLSDSSVFLRADFSGTEPAAPLTVHCERERDRPHVSCAESILDVALPNVPRAELRVDVIESAPEPAADALSSPP